MCKKCPGNFVLEYSGIVLHYFRVNPEGRSSQVAERRVDLDLGGEQGARRPRDNAHRQVRVERDSVPARPRLLRPGPRGIRSTGGAPGGGEGDAHRDRPRRQTRQLWCVPTVDSLLPFCEWSFRIKSDHPKNREFICDHLIFL